MTTRNHFNVIILTHIEGDITIADMRVIDAWACDTTESALEVVERVHMQEAPKYARRIQVYVQPYEKA